MNAYVTAFATLVVLASGANMRNGHDDEYLRVMEACVATNLELSGRLYNGYLECFSDNDGEAAGRKMANTLKSVLARNADECPSVSDVQAYFEGQMAGEICFLNMIGWMNNDYEFNEDQINADIATLPEEVSSQLSEDAVMECAADEVELMAEDPEFAPCLNGYSAEEIEAIEMIATMAAGVNCFGKQFEEACYNYDSMNSN